MMKTRVAIFITSLASLSMAAAPTASAAAVPTQSKPTPSPVVKQTASTNSGALSGSFSWSVDIKCCLTSRKWAQGSGSTTITSSSVCSGGSDFRTYYIELFRDEIIDDSKGRIPFSCNRDLPHTWTGLRGGTYYFRILKQDDRRTRVQANGRVIYP